MDIVELTQQALTAGDWAVYNSWPVAARVFDLAFGWINWSGVGA